MSSMKFPSFSFWLALAMLGLMGRAEGVSYVYDHLYNMLNTISFAKTVPQISGGAPLTLSLQLELHRVVKADVANQELVADGVLHMRWNDFRLAFDPWMFNNIDHFIWPNLDNIWTPDIVVFNGLDSHFDTSRETSSVIVNNLGNVTWSRPLRMRVPCALTGTNTIADSTCTVAFSSWSHSVDSVHLVTATDRLGLWQYWTDSRYDVTGEAVTSSTRTVGCCPSSTFDVIKYEMIVSG